MKYPKISNEFGNIPIELQEETQILNGIHVVQTGGPSSLRLGKSLLTDQKFLYQAHTEVEYDSGTLVPLDACFTLMRTDFHIADENGFFLVAVKPVNIVKKDRKLILMHHRNAQKTQIALGLQGKFKDKIVMYAAHSETRKNYYSEKMFFVHEKQITCIVELDDDETYIDKVEVPRIWNKDKTLYGVDNI